MANKPWTYPEKKRLEELIVRFNVESCAMILERSTPCIISMMVRMGLKSPHNVGKKRVLFADSIATIFELVDMGFDHVQISQCFRVSVNTIQVSIKKAEREGFDAFPKRTL